MRGINVIIIIIIIIIIIMLCYIGRVIAASTFVLSDFFVCLILWNVLLLKPSGLLECIDVKKLFLRFLFLSRFFTFFNFLKNFYNVFYK